MIAIATAESQTIDKLTFYRGLLYALRLQLGDATKFFTHDASFHRAFGAAVSYAKATWPGGSGRPIETHEDPIFGEYEEAREMLLEGEQDRLLSLMNPRLQKGSFTITREEARAELDELPHADWFVTLGKMLAKELRSA